MFYRSYSTLAEYTLLELLYRGKEAKLAQQRPVVLALLPFHMFGMDAGMNSLKQLSDHGVRLWVWAEDEVVKHYDQTDLVDLVGTDCLMTGRLDMNKRQFPFFEHVFIPVLSFSLIADILSLNERRPFVRIVLEALFTGKNVTALSIGANPDHSAWRRHRWNQGTPYLRLEVKKKLEQLQNFGINLIDNIDATQIGQTFSTRNKRVLLEEDIITAHMEGKEEVYVSNADLVTPLAGDYAEAHGIRIIRE